MQRCDAATCAALIDHLAILSVKVTCVTNPDTSTARLRIKQGNRGGWFRWGAAQEVQSGGSRRSVAQVKAPTVAQLEVRLRSCRAALPLLGGRCGNITYSMYLILCIHISTFGGV